MIDDISRSAMGITSHLLKLMAGFRAAFNTPAAVAGDALRVTRGMAG